jgi:hypothetical protein
MSASVIGPMFLSCRRMVLTYAFVARGPSPGGELRVEW